MLISLKPALADQLAWITKAEADKAVAFLKSQKQIMLYCPCCDVNDAKRIVNVKKVYARNPSMGGTVYKEYWEVVVEGTYADDGSAINEGLDLAYVYVKKGNAQANCLGVELGFECDPCIDLPLPFTWKASLFFKETLDTLTSWV
ncbi:MAG: hypothetical protein EAZ55_10965 [Cytophagales bacterium]|nr:MAG: hypothetical protein EAZ55_10965 [Cytophagales bacterium]